MPNAFDVDYPRTLTSAFAAIQNDGQSLPIPCRGVSVDTAGNFTLTNPDGSTVVVNLAAGVIHTISTRVALTGAGAIRYWY